MVSDVHQVLKQTETGKGGKVVEVSNEMEDRFRPNFSLGVSQEQKTQEGVEEEEYEMPADVDHESVNQDPEAGKDNLIEEMELKTSSENINRQRLTGRTKVASEALRSPYLVREVDITKSITKEDDWVWKFIWTDPKKIEESSKKLFPDYMMINIKMDEKQKKKEKNKGRGIFEYVFIPDLKV
ncbi:hypothetical protein L1987_08650 [Smallanthus sonchifolius]|uniref:Uncharacterized protein n=1 Tax=Smallanthus sonchifolius TaxID=185202 RepID=A0ACB9JKR9_9ASTR|nr:hypothetical protein L1987_08650 [Smallanthus sonchifolius]